MILEETPAFLLSTFLGEDTGFCGCFTLNIRATAKMTAIVKKTFSSIDSIFLMNTIGFNIVVG